jgi:hypothetical protein
MQKHETSDQEPQTEDEQVACSNQLLAMIRERMAERKKDPRQKKVKAEDELPEEP